MLRRIHPRPLLHLHTVSTPHPALYLGQPLNRRRAYAGLKSSMVYLKRIRLLLGSRLEQRLTPVFNPRLQERIS